MLAMDAIRPSFVIWQRGRREDSAQQQKNQNPPVEQPCDVGYGLMMGDLDDAQNTAMLVRRGVKGVLLLCPDKVERDSEGQDKVALTLQAAGLRYLSLPAHDSRHFDIVSETFPSAFQFLEEFSGDKVLVCCYGGVNRSGAVVVGFLALRRGLPLTAAMQTATEARGTVLMNMSFRRLLVRAVLGLGAMPKRDHLQPQAGAASKAVVRRSSPSAFCCKRKKIAGDESLHARWVFAGVGHAVHGFGLWIADRSRRGVFLEDDGAPMPNLSNDKDLQRRKVRWVKLNKDEYIVEVAGHACHRRYLAADIVLKTNAGRQLDFCGPEYWFEQTRRKPFQYQARPGHAIVEILFDLKGNTCSGVRDLPMP